MESINGDVIKHGAIIQWYVEGSDDNTVWTLLGIVHDYTQLNPPFYSDKQYVVYLGGGDDFGMDVGNRLTFEKVLEDSENNDTVLQGIKVLGKCSEIPRIIKKICGGW